jgi:membrane associated rhomboid family serine protease
MQSEKNEKPLLGADNNALIALLAINLVGYVMLGLIKVVYYLESLPLPQFYAQIMNPFILDTNWLPHPWALFTYNWIHDGFWVLFANMIWLTVFSNALQTKGANKHIFPIYFYSGLLGALVFIITGSNQPLLGAGVSVTGIVIASMTLIPNYKLLTNLAGGIPIWLLGIVFVVLEGYSLLAESLANNIAIVMGGLFGLIYILLLKKGKDLGKWMHQLLHLVNNSLTPKS